MPEDTPDSPPHLTLVIPTLNEERYIERCVTSLLEDGYPRERLEILVIDGGSNDRTVDICESLAVDIPQLRVLRNPARIQAAAFNLGLKECSPHSTRLLRCDAHAVYPHGFVTAAVAAVERTGAGVVGFRAAPLAESAFQRAVAFAQSTRLGVGGSQYRLKGRSGWVDSAMHGCFRRDAVEAVGGYDESFTHNEDSELSLRLRKAGYRVWLEGDLEIGYFPRRSPIALARQYASYGRGRARTCRKHAVMPRPRQLAPVALLGLNAVSIALATRTRAGLLTFFAYLCATIGASTWAALRKGDPALLMGAVALVIMHHAWGLGFLREISCPE